MSNTYQLGLLHIVYTLINVDGKIDEREMNSLQVIQQEESMSDELFREFSRSIVGKSKKEVHTKGLELLGACSEEEKMCAFVHLFKLAEADTSICMEEVRLLLTALKMVNIDFEDIAAVVRMSSHSKTAA